MTQVGFAGVFERDGCTVVCKAHSMGNILAEWQHHTAPEGNQSIRAVASIIMSVDTAVGVLLLWPQCDQLSDTRLWEMKALEYPLPQIYIRYASPDAHCAVIDEPMTVANSRCSRVTSLMNFSVEQ